MAAAYTNPGEMEEFAPAFEYFERMVESLGSQETAQSEHGDVEQMIEAKGHELLRRLFQGHLDLRAGQEPEREAVQGSDEVARTHRRDGCATGLVTKFGRVRISRRGYGARGEGSLFPLDGELNLPPDCYSDGLRRRVSEEVARGSFDEAVRSVARTTGGKVPKRQCEEFVAKVAQDFEPFYEKRRQDGAGSADDMLALSVDAKGVVMRQVDLREATRKAAERESGKRKVRLGRGKKRNRKRMATVASVYEVAPHARTAEQVMGGGNGPGRAPRPKARRKRVWASVEREPEDVLADAFQEALGRDPRRQRRWVVLVDGDEHQLERIKAEVERRHLEVTLVLDLVHVLEYLWKASYCFCPPGSDRTESRVARRALSILKGRSSEVAAHGVSSRIVASARAGPAARGHDS